MPQYQVMPELDPNDKDWYFVVWCSPDGTNDGSEDDVGKLQGATISSVTWTIPDGITRLADNKSAVNIHGVLYGANTVCSIKLTGGTDQMNYDIICSVVMSDGREKDKTIRVPVRQQ